MANETTQDTSVYREPIRNFAAHGRTVMLTRAQAQSAELVAALERDGARVVACPTIEIVEPELYASLDEAIGESLRL